MRDDALYAADITEDLAQSIRIESKLGQTADTFLRDIACMRDPRLVIHDEFARTKWVAVCRDLIKLIRIRIYRIATCDMNIRVTTR